MPGHLQVVGEAVTARISELQSQAMANIAWGYSQLGTYHQAMFESIAREAPAKLGDFRAQVRTQCCAK